MAKADHIHDELASFIAPFVGAKLNRQVDPASQYGAYLPRLAAIDIIGAGHNRRDADVRSISPEGVEVFFYNQCELVAWSNIDKLVIASLDEDEERLSERVIERASGRRIAA